MAGVPAAPQVRLVRLHIGMADIGTEAPGWLDYVYCCGTPLKTRPKSFGCVQNQFCAKLVGGDLCIYVRRNFGRRFTCSR